MQRAQQAVRFLVRTVAFLTAVAVVLLGVRITFSGTQAYASSDIYNPSYCLGAWENPRAASGAREVSEDAVFNDFGPTNAAFLPHEASSLLFCGYFAIEQRERPPEKVTLSFVWSLDPLFLDAYREGQPSSGAAPSTSGTEDSVSSTPVDDEGGVAPTPNETAAPNQSDTNAPAEQGPADNSHSAPPAVAEDAVTAPVEVPVDVPAPAPVVDIPPPPPTEAPVSAKEMLQRIAYFLTPIAHAQESLPTESVVPAETPAVEVQPELPAVVPDESSLETTELAPDMLPSATDTFRDAAFVRVSYSFDGANWVPLQAAGTKNWNQFQVEIPAGSWEELQNLQIMLLPLPGDGNRPPLYLDAVELTVEQDLTFTEIATDTVESALALLDAAATSITDAFTPNSNEDALLAAAGGALSPSPQLHEHTKEVLVYTFAGSPLPVVSNLPWHPEKFAATLPPNADLPAPQVAIDTTGRELSVRGQCDDEYYVVLTFRNPDDYYTAPQQFTSNYAGVCDGGSFLYEVTHLPENTPDGTYYLLLATQGSDTPWVPTSKLLPIQIGRAQVVVREDAQ